MTLLPRRAFLAAPLLFAPNILRAQTTALRVMTFPGMGNLPLFGAEHSGAFARRGIAVEILNTPTSAELRNGLAAGRHHLVVGGVDNAIAMAEAGHDIGLLIGGDTAFNSLFVKPDIAGWSDLRGKTLIVDAPDTAYALVAYRMLERNGLPRGSYTVRPTGATFARLELMLRDPSAHASMLNPPFSLLGLDQGLRSLGEATEVIGPYLGNAGWAMRAWARENPDLVTRYLAATIEGFRWMKAPANTEVAIGLLSEKLRLAPAMARRCLALWTDPRGGAAVDGRFDLEGFRAVLRLRAEVLGNWGGTPPAPDRYLELGYWERARASL